MWDVVDSVEWKSVTLTHPNSILCDCRVSPIVDRPPSLDRIEI